MTRLLRYSVAVSLDGYIADDGGGYDWIIDDVSIDFPAYLAKIDTLLMGRGTWDVIQTPEAVAILDGMKVFVVSTTISSDADERITVISSDVESTVAALKEEPGKDIWLFGGGVLFRSLLEAGLVDRVEVAIIPALLGSGVPLLPGLEGVAKLMLHSSEVFDSGIVLQKYEVDRSATRAP
jgi:dihydrofolate reductase